MAHSKPPSTPRRQISTRKSISGHVVRTLPSGPVRLGSEQVEVCGRNHFLPLRTQATFYKGTNSTEPFIHAADGMQQQQYAWRCAQPSQYSRAHSQCFAPHPSQRSGHASHGRPSTSRSTTALPAPGHARQCPQVPPRTPTPASTHRNGACYPATHGARRSAHRTEAAPHAHACSSWSGSTSHPLAPTSRTACDGVSDQIAALSLPKSNTSALLLPHPT